MLTVFYGNDTVAVRRDAMHAVDGYSTAGYSIARYSAEEFAPGLLINLLQADSLFGEKEVIVLDTPSEQTEFYEAVSTVVPELVASNVPFFIIEQALLAPQLRLFTKAGATVHEAKKTSTQKFNTFSMADALLSRDKKTLWILLQEARLAEVASEEIIGILWWQLKTLRLTYVSKNASEAGVKEFPYNKVKRGQSKFTKDEADALALSLLEVYHDGHGGRRDIATALERWVLGL
jgi:DNA polymerase III delta subunit